MTQLWILAAGAAVAGLVQGISGFAFSMVAMSIWVWGIDPQQAAVMAVFGGVTGQIMSAIRVRRGWHLSLLWPFLVGSAVGIPLGTRLLPLLDPNRFKLVLGAMLVVCCSAMLATAKLPKITHGGRFADAVVGLLGGVMAPLSGFSGLAPALWATLARLLQGRASRGAAELQPGGPVRHLRLVRVAGRARAEHLPQMAVVAGSLIVPSIYGSKIYIGMSPTAFRNVVLWLLVFAGVTMLAAALRAIY